MMIFPDDTAYLLGASEHLRPMVTDYLLWFVPSWIFQIWIAVSLFIIRLDGAPKLAMFCSLVTAVINVVLDWIFIFPFGWGVMGAALATSISIISGGIIAICPSVTPVSFEVECKELSFICQEHWLSMSHRFFGFIRRSYISGINVCWQSGVYALFG